MKRDSDNVMVLTCFASSGPGPIAVINGTRKSVRQEVLQSNFISCLGVGCRTTQNQKIQRLGAKHKIENWSSQS